jgi:hypothetical protein
MSFLTLRDVRDWDEKKRQFEVIVGKSILAFTREDEEDGSNRNGMKLSITHSMSRGSDESLRTNPPRDGWRR